MSERKPKLSGAQRRKLARQRAQERLKGVTGGAAVRPLSAELLPPVRLEDMDTVGAYRRELNRVYGQMRGGELLPETGTKLVFVLCQGAGLARIEQELREAALIREQLIRLNEHTGAVELLQGPGSVESNGYDHDAPSTLTLSPSAVQGEEGAS